nr:MAG TPA: hypothetical protein [Bacteriophage sp.]
MLTTINTIYNFSILLFISMCKIFISLLIFCLVGAVIYGMCKAAVEKVRGK